MDKFNLERYLSDGVRDIVSKAVKATLTNPRESVFLAKYSLSAKKAERIRREYENNGEHIPPFIIASITSACNLHCAGCYSRANHACVDCPPVGQMSADEWEIVFKEAVQLGIGFILLAGGEPLLRKDVVSAAAKYPEIIFPIFTNGTMLDDEYFSLLDEHRNLIPVVSIEGHKQSTDLRRGEGMYDKVLAAMARMKERRLTFGASVTQTTANTDEITSDEFIGGLRENGVKIVFFVEYVPVAADTAYLAPSDTEREIMEKRLNDIRERYTDVLFISFPGDEKSSGGCLAAGRGFFHINSHGGAEPCPFSPFSDINVKNTSLREVLKSPLFSTLRDENVLTGEHVGGCVLYERRGIVENLIKQG